METVCVHVRVCVSAENQNCNRGCFPQNFNFSVIVTFGWGWKWSDSVVWKWNPACVILYKEEKARDLVWASCSSEADEFQLLKLDEAEQSKKTKQNKHLSNEIIKIESLYLFFILSDFSTGSCGRWSSMFIHKVTAFSSFISSNAATMTVLCS